MKHTLQITLAALVSIAFILAVVAAVLMQEERLPTNAKSKLTDYLTYQQAISARTLVVQQVTHAIRPARFAPSMSARTYGESLYYRTTYNYLATPIVSSLTLPLSTPDILSPTEGLRPESTPGALSAAEGQRPLPYPPVDLWCALLGQESAASRSIVFLALHQDMYNADWVLHEGAKDPPAPEAAAVLSEVGCELGLGH